MRVQAAPGTWGRRALRATALAALVASVGQVSLGGVVRVTGSGLGCPDWPLCHGKIIPPMEAATLIEYSHRLSAAFVGVLVLATTAVAWGAFRSDNRVTLPSSLALVLVISAALFGGLTVLMELDWWTVLVHLAIAEFLVATLVVVAVVAWRPVRAAYGDLPRAVEVDGFDLLLIASLVGAFVLLLSGSYMVGQGYASSCGTWPLCGGAAFPEGVASATHMAHRYVAALIGVLVALTVISAWTHRAMRPDLKLAALVVAGLFAAQVIVGAVTVWAGFPAGIKGLHLALGTVVWASLVYLAASNFLGQHVAAEATTAGSDRLPRLERAES